MREAEAKIDDLHKIINALHRAQYFNHEIANLFLTGLMFLGEEKGLSPGEFFSALKQTAIAYKQIYEREHRKDVKK